MAGLPKTYRKLVVKKLTTDFRKAVEIETVQMCHPKEDEVCIRNRYVGVNATDVNITKGRYFTDGNVPFDIGFEGVGEVVAVGSRVKNISVGSAVAYMSSTRNAYAEYVCTKPDAVFPIPEAKPEYVVLLVSGLTSSVGLDKAARITNGETVLITAAAGGAGHIAIQWAKAAECTVIGTCSSKEKETVLKELGCDHVINYKDEDIGEALSKRFPKGVDVIWETIGGKVLEACLQNLAVKGRLLIIGGISGYKEENTEAFPKMDLSWLPSQLLLKSASVHGFLVLHYQDCFLTYFKYLSEHLENGKIRALYDLGPKGDEFVGLEGVIRGVEYLHSGKSIGKVLVKFP